MINSSLILKKEFYFDIEMLQIQAIEDISFD